MARALSKIVPRKAAEALLSRYEILLSVCLYVLLPASQKNNPNVNPKLSTRLKARNKLPRSARYALSYPHPISNTTPEAHTAQAPPNPTSETTPVPKKSVRFGHA